MRRFHARIAGVLLLLLLFGQCAVAADDILIDVEDGNLKTGRYDIPLSKTVERPISIGMENESIILIVLTDAGSTIRLNLGQGRAALTKRANAYVRIMQATDAANENAGQANPEDDGNCKACGKPLVAGDHSRYPCGHYVCVVGLHHRGGLCPTCNQPLCDGGNHTVCPQCGVGFCGHDDSACSYRDDPASYPFVTTDSSGETLYFYLSPSGEFVIGNPTGEESLEWSPAYEYLYGSWPVPSPSPSPTWRPTDGYWYIDEQGKLKEYNRKNPPPGWHWSDDESLFVPNTPAPRSPTVP